MARKLDEKQRQLGIIVLIFIAAATTVTIVRLPYIKEMGLQGLFKNASQELVTDNVTVTEVIPDWIAFNVTMDNKLLDDNVNGTEYYIVISNMDADEQDDIRYNDLKVGEKKTDLDVSDHFDIEDDEAQVFKLTHEDSFVYWITDWVPGVNQVEMMNRSSSVYLTGYSETGNTTLTNTTIRDWTFGVKAAAHGDYVQGFEGLLLDYPNFCWNMTGIRFKFNMTAKYTFFDGEDVIREDVSGDYLYVWYGDDWTSEAFSFYEGRFGSGLGTDFEVLEAAPVWGNLVDGTVSTIGTAIS